MTILLACAVASWLLFSGSEPETKPAAAPPALRVGYYATGVTLSGSDEDGRILYRVSADTVEQQPTDGSIDLDRVEVGYTPAARIAWALHSDTGRIPPGGKIVQLIGNVVAETQGTERPAMVIHTDHLDFDTRTDVAATDGEVTINYDGSAVRATGLQARLAEDRLELLSGVTGTYVR
jgi:lipopolysaccharide export system protein LptC